MLSEKIELLGKGLYADKNIPDTLTLKSIPTATELDYVGAEDFNHTMLTKVLPKSIEEDIPFGELLAIDYYWICRGLRMLSYGPYYTTNAIFCADCRDITRGETIVDLRTVGCNVLPKGFNNNVIIDSSEFIQYDKTLTIRLLTINESIMKDQDKMFEFADGTMNRNLSTVCYAVKEINGKFVTPLDVKSEIEKNMISADYSMLKDLVHDKLNYGLQSGGRTTCPKCGSSNGAFMALIDDRFFRPTLGDLRTWKADLNSRRETEDVSGDTTVSI